MAKDVGVCSSSRLIFKATLITALVSFLILPFTTASAPSNGTVPIDTNGLWTIKALGYSDIVMPTDSQIQLSESVKYRLPKGATQGQKTWYLIFLHFIMEVDEDTDEGLIYLSGGTNDRTAAQIRLETLGPNRGVIWSIVDMINGSQTGLSFGNRIELSTVNFLQYGGVFAGDNFLNFQLERFGGAKVKRLVILEDSGIIRTPLGPPKLELDVTVPRRRVKAGDEFTVTVHLKNKGWPAKDVKLLAIYPQDGLEAVTPDFYYLPSFRGKSPLRFTFKVLKEGLSNLEIKATGRSGGGTRRILEVNTLATPRERMYLGLPWHFWIGVGLVAVVALLLVSVVYRRKSTSHIGNSP